MLHIKYPTNQSLCSKQHEPVRPEVSCLTILLKHKAFSAFDHTPERLNLWPLVFFFSARYPFLLFSACPPVLVPNFFSLPAMSFRMLMYHLRTLLAWKMLIRNVKGTLHQFHISVYLSQGILLNPWTQLYISSVALKLSNSEKISDILIIIRLISPNEGHLRLGLRPQWFLEESLCWSMEVERHGIYKRVYQKTPLSYIMGIVGPRVLWSFKVRIFWPLLLWF